MKSLKGLADACSTPPREAAPLLEEEVSTPPEYLCVSHGTRGIKSKRAWVKGPVWIRVLGGQSETCCPALPEVPMSGVCLSVVSQRQRLQVTAVGTARHEPVASVCPESGGPSVVPGDSLAAVTFQGVSLTRTPLHACHQRLRRRHFLCATRASVWGRDVQMDTESSSFTHVHSYHTAGFSGAALTPNWGQPGSGSESLLGLGRFSPAPDTPWHVTAFLGAY